MVASRLWVPGRGKPDYGDLQALRNELSSHYAQRNAEMQTDEPFYFGTFPTKVPPKMTLRRASTGYNIVREMIAHILGEMPIIRVPRRADTEKAQQQAERLTYFLNAAWGKIGGERFLARLMWHGLVRGPMVSRVIPDLSRPLPPRDPGPQPALPDDLLIDDDSAAEWSEAVDDWLRAKQRFEDAQERWENSSRDNLPYIVDAIDPRYAFWQPTTIPRYCIISWKRRAADIRRVWGDDVLADVSDSQEVEWCEFWSDEYYAYWAEWWPSRPRHYTSQRDLAPAEPSRDWIMPPTEHGFGYFPINVDGPYETPLDDPARQFTSIYFAIRDALTLETESLSQNATLSEKLAWASLIVKTERTRSFRLNKGPDETNYIMPDEDINFLIPQLPMQYVQTMTSLAQQFIERTSIQGVLLGQVRARSGYQQAQLAALAKVVFVPVEKALARMMVSMNEAFLKIIENVIQGPVHAWGFQGREPVDATIRPEDIRGYYRSTVEFRTIRPIDEGARLANIERLLKLGVSRLRALEEAGIERPEAELVRREAEDLLQHPDVRQARALRAARNWGFDQETQDLIMASRIRLLQGQAGAGGGAAGSLPSPAAQASQPPSPPEPNSAGEVDLSLRQMQQGTAQPRRLPPTRERTRP